MQGDSVIEVLTICLVTKGRNEVFEFLDSAESFAALDFVHFLIIDNGAPQEIGSLIANWASSRPRVTLLKLERNTTDWNEIWPIIASNSSEWLIFPGDDDLLLIEGFMQWNSLLKRQPGVEVFAMSAKVIDSQGCATGEILQPEYSPEGDISMKIAQALHSPPFVWPSLFFKKSLIQGPFPKSRFVLDWWISVKLVMCAEISTSPACTLEYRRHSTQESSLASLNRKCFEGMYHLDNLLASEFFLAWLKSLEEVTLIELWNSLNRIPPIYGEKDLSNLLLFRIAKLLISITSNEGIHNQIMADLSLKFGVLLHDMSVSDTLDLDVQASFGNLSIANNYMSCPTLSPMLHNFRGSSTSLKVSISCPHDSTTPKSIFINCVDYRNLSSSQQLDRLTQEISCYLEIKGLVAFRISPRERSLIAKIRRVKEVLPQGLLRIFRRIL